jgi:hypothetical protein
LTVPSGLTTEQEKILKIRTELEVAHFSSMKHFAVATTRRQKRRTLLRKLLSMTSSVSFELSASLLDTGFSDAEDWSLSVMSTLSNASFAIDLRQHLGVNVSISSVFSSILTRPPSLSPTDSPSIVPSRNPTTYLRPTLIPSTQNSEAPTVAPNVLSDDGINSASTGSIIVVGMVALAAAAMYSICGLRRGMKRKSSTPADGKLHVKTVDISRRAEFTTMLATIDQVTSWSFVFIALEQKTFSVAVLSFTSNCLLLMVRIKIVTYVFDKLFEYLGDREQLKQIHGRKSGRMRLYLMYVFYLNAWANANTYQISFSSLLSAFIYYYAKVLPRIRVCRIRPMETK